MDGFIGFIWGVCLFLCLIFFGHALITEYPIFGWGLTIALVIVCIISFIASKGSPFNAE